MVAPPRGGGFGHGRPCSARSSQVIRGDRRPSTTGHVRGVLPKLFAHQQHRFRVERDRYGFARFGLLA